MSVLMLATIGGTVSFMSTSLGSVLTQVFTKTSSLNNLHMSMDFTLGVMLSAAAFLIAPELASNVSLGLLGLALGIISIILLHNTIHNLSHGENKSSYLLIAALIFHNFPEGMGAGASLAGMEWSTALSLQTAIAVQNIFEGMVLTLLLISLDVKIKWAVIGGIFSGVIELGGGILAGLLLEQTLATLPFLLSLAGGAMMGSVVLEIWETRKINPAQFIMGSALIPIMNYFLP
ncbi:MAG: ZIP family metal transporter [Bacteriovoracaceae bacterium]